MQPDQAQFLLQTYIPAIENEWEITKRVFAAVPETNSDYRPDPKAKTAAEIVWHIVSSEVWFLGGLINGEFAMEEKSQPDDVKTVPAIIEWFEKTAPPLYEKIKELPPESLAKPISFFGLLNYPAVVYLSLLLSHTIHHRGQLATYLRPMGGKVPCIYGGSADEPFEMPK